METEVQPRLAPHIGGTTSILTVELPARGEYDPKSELSLKGDQYYLRTHRVAREFVEALLANQTEEKIASQRTYVRRLDSAMVTKTLTYDTHMRAMTIGQLLDFLGKLRWFAGRLNQPRDLLFKVFAPQDLKLVRAGYEGVLGEGPFTLTVVGAQEWPLGTIIVAR